MTNSILHVEAYDTEVNRIVEDVLLTMTDYPVAAACTEYFEQSDRATCAVFFTGEWAGAVLIECPMGMALEFTARLMRIPKPVQFDDDVFDALGELANMIGGNLKSVLPRGVNLSMPSVVEGPKYSMRVCGGHQYKRMAFAGPNGAFWVTLVETTAPSSLN